MKLLQKLGGKSERHNRNGWVWGGFLHHICNYVYPANPMLSTGRLKTHSASTYIQFGDLRFSSQKIRCTFRDKINKVFNIETG